MNEIQIKIMRHLTSGGDERLQALDDLARRSVFLGSRFTETTKNEVEKYLTENPRGFSVGGIQRFRDAVGLPAKPKTRTTTVKFVVDVEIESDVSSWPTWEPTFTASGPTAKEIERVIPLAHSTFGRGTSHDVKSTIKAARVSRSTVIRSE